MSRIIRAKNSTTGDVTINNGDLIVTSPTGGIILTDNTGTENRLTIIDDAGSKTIEITEIP